MSTPGNGWPGAEARRSGTLYLAAVVATRNNAAIKTVYQWLCGVGKAKNVARIACMRKLLTTPVRWRPSSIMPSPSDRFVTAIRRISSVFPTIDALR